MNLSNLGNLSIQPGSLVLVSGANGFIASHIIKKLLENGYKVRGTVRNAERASWLPSLFNKKYGAGSLEIVSVPDMALGGAFDEAVMGCSGFIHTATPVLSINDPNIAIPMVISGVTSALKSAASAGIKRFVYTSSSVAVANPQPNKVFKIDSTVWNEEAIKAAWAPPPYDGMQRRMDVYGASKTQGEQAAWEFVKSPQASGITLNCVLPNMNIGEILSIKHQGYPSTTSWIKALWNGFADDGEAEVKHYPPQYYINVDDTAAVHVAALIYEDVKSERLLAFAKPYSWNTILQLLRNMYPAHQFIEDIDGLGEDRSIVANDRAEELLKRISGHSWTGLEDSIRPLTDVLSEGI